MRDVDVKEVFEREYERMVAWLGTWVSTGSAKKQTGNAMAAAFLTASGGWISRRGPLQHLYSHAPTSKTLSASALGLQGPSNGMKNWTEPSAREIRQLCQVYVAIGYVNAMTNPREELMAGLMDLILELCAPTSGKPFQYSALKISGETRGILKHYRQGLGVLGESTSSWGYAMNRLWDHEVHRTEDWIDDVNQHARRL